MRVQVARSKKVGFCEMEDCRFGEILTEVSQMVVFLGNNCSSSRWFCNECYAALETDASFDIEQVPIDTRGPPDRRTKKTSRKRELEVADRMGGRRQPGSGNQPFTKGDVRKKGAFRIELKECFGLEFKAHRVDLLDKIRSECSPGEHPAVVVTFRDRGTHQELESWAMLPFEIWEDYVNAAGKNR